MFRLLSWEHGLNEGEFDTLAEAKAYVREEDLDVIIHDTKSGKSLRYNATLASVEQHETEYGVDQMLLGYYYDEEGEK